MFKSLIPLALLATSAFAQTILIDSPQKGATVKAGGKLLVTLTKPNSVSSEEVAVVIGIQSCANSPCRDPSDIMGTILYNGRYNPQSHGTTQPYQNFSVTIPQGLPSGTAQLDILHVALIGGQGGNAPLHETLNQIITIG